jgi:hypothetical protein
LRLPPPLLILLRLPDHADAGHEQCVRLARVANISFEWTTKACLPFLVPLLVSLALVIYWPSMVMFLPNLFYK